MTTYVFRSHTSPRIWHRHGEHGWHWASDNHPDGGRSHREDNVREDYIWVASKSGTFPRYSTPSEWNAAYLHDLQPWVGLNKKRTTFQPQLAVHPVTGEWGWRPIDGRAFGVEIECFMPIENFQERVRESGLIIHREAYGHRAPQNWKLVADGSLRHTPYSLYERGYQPIEVVSPVLRGGTGVEQLRKICNALKAVDARITKECGLHIHHEAQDLSLDAFKLVGLNYAAAQTAFNQIVSPNRRNNRYARPFEWFDKDQIQRASRKDYVGGSSDSDRYKVLNLGPAYRRHKTLEFRQHQGTIEFKKITAWVMLGKALIEASRRGKVIPENLALETVLQTITDDTVLRNYYQARARQLARSN